MFSFKPEVSAEKKSITDIFLLTLFPPQCFDLVFALGGKNHPYLISNGRIANTGELAHALSTSRSLKKSKKQIILPWQFFAGGTIFNKNTVFFVFSLHY